MAQDRESKRQTDWAEQDLAIILTGPLAGHRADELRQANIGDIRTTKDGATVIHVKGKGGTGCSEPLRPNRSRSLTHLDSRTIWFPEAVMRTAAAAGSSLSQWQASSPRTDAARPAPLELEPEPVTPPRALARSTIAPGTRHRR